MIISSCGKRLAVFSVSLCSSRACLGKLIVSLKTRRCKRRLPHPGLVALAAHNELRLLLPHTPDNRRPVRQRAFARIRQLQHAGVVRAAVLSVAIDTKVTRPTETNLLASIFRCSSRACHGKSIVFAYKWLKKAFNTPRVCHCVHHVFGICLAAEASKGGGNAHLLASRWVLSV